MLAASAIVLAIIAAIRGMWSPCGLSMLSTITPMAERLRGHRFGATASWFIAGAIFGGATLGLCSGLGAAAVHLLDLPSVTWSIVALGFGLFCLLADAEIGPFRLPAIRRQVNERWVEQYRPSVYASGYGWQLGAGLSTYVMTTANYLMVAMCLVSGSAALAMVVCCVFGVTRGCVILVNAKVTSTSRLVAIHRFLDANVEQSKLLCLGAEALVIATGATTLFGAFGITVGLAAFALGVLARRRAVLRDTSTELVSK